MIMMIIVMIIIAIIKIIIMVGTDAAIDNPIHCSLKTWTRETKILQEL